MLNIPEGVLVVNAINPQVNTGALAGAYISLKTAHKAWVVFHVTQGNAAQPVLSLTKATAVAGTGETAVTAEMPIWAVLDAATSDVFDRVADAASYTLDVGLANKLVVFQVDPAALGDYDCIAAAVGASNIANIVSALYLIEPRYAEGENQPSVIVD